MANTTQIGPKLWEELFGSSSKASTNRYYNDLVDKYTSNPSEYNANLVEQFDSWRNTRFAKLGVNMKKSSGYKLAPGVVDDPNLTPLEGLEGPFRYPSGKVLYYDPKAGKYYDRSSDFYVSDEEMAMHWDPRLVDKKREEFMKTLNPKSKMHYKKKILARMSDEYEVTSDPSVYKKIHKIKNMRDEGKCTLCPPHSKENVDRRPRQDKRKNKDRETIRKTQAMQKAAGYEYLIDVVMSPQEGVGDRRGSRKFTDAWNAKYPSYPVRIQMNPHDFGSYPSVVMETGLYERAFNDSKVFPSGPEDASVELADELGLDY